MFDWVFRVFWETPKETKSGTSTQKVKIPENLIGA